MARRLDDLRYPFTTALKADPSRDNRPRQVSGAHFSWVSPQSFSQSQLIATNIDLATELGLDIDNDEDFVAAMSGALPEHVTPFAMNYGGHQFGNWAGQLGDGRAINIGSLVGIDTKLYDLQLKGAGPTPYSRMADGYAVLRSSIREYLCSEAIYALGVPTTRALALTLTGEPVLRDMMYNGNAAYEPGAIVCRVSESFVRFGHFEIFAARGERDLLQSLLDYVIERHYSELTTDADGYVGLLAMVGERTRHMVIEWMRVGYVHGVMNTDNMSILGETIDYGPYGWIDHYDPHWTPNTTDLPGRRYAFGQQPVITQWNLIKLANAIATIIPDRVSELSDILTRYPDEYHTEYTAMMRRKLGLVSTHYDDHELIESLTDIMYKDEIDMTIFFRNLATLTKDNISDKVIPSSYKGEVSHEMTSWLHKYLSRCHQEGLDPQTRQNSMYLANPKYVLRNYIAQIVIDAAHKGEYALLHEVYAMLRNPYEEQESYQYWYALRPDWAVSKVGCSMLSCSS
jgi:serine/tyrosine/threonine adenylyltransferase